MKVVLKPSRVIEALEYAPSAVKKAFFKQTRLLAADLRHPSLQAKKFDEVEDLWQARVNRDWRFYFAIENET